MKKWALTVVLIAAFVGIVLSAISTSQHMRIMREGFEKESFCAISETINCDIVNASSYSEFLGVPVAWWGLCYYFAIFGSALIARFSRQDKKATIAVAWFISIGGIIYSAWLAYIAFFVLGVVCIECLSMYAANIVLLIFLYRALGIPLSKIFQFVRDYVLAVFGRPSNLGFAPKIITHAIVYAAVFLIGWGIISAAQAKGVGGENRASVAEKVSAFYMQSLHDINVDPRWSVWGNPNAPVTIVEFSEFQCPFCKIEAFTVKPYLQEFKNNVRFYFVNYPLDNACNVEMTRPMHQYACFAAKAGICADQRGGFWPFHDEMFRKQKFLSEETILKIADERGWNRDEFMACINSPETDKRVRADISVAKAIYVDGTPSIFVNGRKLRYWRDPKFLQAVVKEEIKRVKKQ